MNRRFAPLLLAFFLAFAPVVQAQDATPVVGGIDFSGFEAVENDCTFLNAAGAMTITEDAGEVSCGTVTVPEDWANPDGRQLEIAYVVLKSTSDAPADDPVIYLSGGPGESALANLMSYVDMFSYLRQDRDVILFDQRGTHFSSPLTCSAFDFMNALAQQDAANDADGEGSDGDTDDSDDSDDTFEFVDADTLMEMARAAVSDSTRQCVQDLTTQGFDLRHYNSRASGNDVIALLSALGVDEYNIYGISYGTRLALSIMRDHPHSGIRSVVLDSTFPPQIHGFEQLPVEAEEVVLQVFSACALDPACDAAYPNLKERFIDLLARLHEEPVMTSFGEPFTADDLVEFVKMVSQQSELGAYIPLVIAQLEMGDTTAVEAIATGGDDEGTVAEEEPATAATPVSEPTAEPTPAPGADEAATFIGIIHDALQGASLADKAEVLYLLALLDQGPHTTEALRVFTYRAFANDEDARAQLLAVIDALTPQGLEQVFVTVEQIDGLLQISTFGLSAEVFNSVECNEEVPFERIEQAVANWHSLQIPELAEQEMVQLAQQFASCELWPSGHAGSIENLPVVSDIPTLIFSGGYDFQTPPTWNKDAFLRLPNATFVNFPATNHAVIAYHGECASDIADAFMDTPFAVPDISCTEDLKPVWILPDGSSTADA